MAKLEEYQVLMLRAIFDGMILLHPAHNGANRAALADLFDLDEEHLDALHALGMWIADHELERAVGMEGPDTREFLRQTAVQTAYDLLYEVTGGPQNVQTAHEQVIKAMSLLVAAGAQPNTEGKD